VSVTGSVTANGGSISGSSGTAFNVGTATANSGGGSNVTYGGSISKTSSGRPVEVRNRTGGTVLLNGTASGGITCNTSCTGINLGTNGAGTVTFAGGMVLSTGGNTAFNATGGGTVNVCATNDCAAGTAVVNTLTTTTGTALNVSSTNIGGSGLTFRSITVSGNGTNPTNGVVLNATGSNAGLTVTGTGSASSGGTIQNTGSHGIMLTNTRDVMLDRMNIQSTGASGVSGSEVTNFTFTNGTVNNSGNANHESNIVG
jgi:hypothetical protein